MVNRKSYIAQYGSGEWATPSESVQAGLLGRFTTYDLRFTADEPVDTPTLAQMSLGKAKC
jgi:hypothetical protein